MSPFTKIQFNANRGTAEPIRPLVILGSGGFAREVFWHFLESRLPEYRALESKEGDLRKYFLFVDDLSTATELDTGYGKYRIVKDWKFEAGLQFLVGIGIPKVKKLMVGKALAAGLTPAPTFIHPRAVVQNADVGLGGIITPGCVVTTQVKLGDYVVLNLNVTVGHDTVIENFVTVNPGCSVSGNNHLKEGAFLGTGTVTREKAVIEKDVVVGAQAAVIQDLLEVGMTAVGAPARKLER